LAGEESEAWSCSTFINFRPVVEHISIHREPGVFAAASAWEIDGASDAIRIAKNAIHAMKRLVTRSVLMARF
jgi:hypothetical protein